MELVINHITISKEKELQRDKHDQVSPYFAPNSFFCRGGALNTPVAGLAGCDGTVVFK